MKSFRSIVANGAALLLLGGGLAVLPATQSQAAGGSATDWMHDGKFGVMEHYLAEGAPPGAVKSDYPNNMPSVAQWNDRVNNYDVDGVVNQLKSVGAGWLQISVGQNTGFYAAPNATFEELVPPTPDHPSRLAKRDLIKELGQALHKEGIKLIVYVTADAVAYDDYARQKLGGSAQGKGEPNADYQRNWLKVVETWSKQWGTDVDGYWVDGPYFPRLEPFYDQMATTLRSGNPKSILSFNASVDEPYKTHTKESDFTPGESPVKYWPRPAAGRFIDNRGTQMQLQYLGPAQGDWGNPPNEPMSFTADQIAEHTHKVTQAGGAVTWDVGYNRSNGRISDPGMEQLKKVGEKVGKLPVPTAETNSAAFAPASGSRL